MFKNGTLATPVKIYRSFLFVATVIGILFFLMPIKSYAGSENTICMDIIHKHEGSSSSYGGCYRTEHSSSYQCNGKTYDIEESHIVAPDGYGLNHTSYGVKCSSCGGEKWFSNAAERWHYNDGGRPGCTHTVASVYYAADCGMENEQNVGCLKLTASTTDWTKEMTLTGSYETEAILDISDSPYIWNGKEAGSEKVIKVTENGEYTLGLLIPEDVHTNVGTITMNIQNIDHTEPVINAVEYDPAPNIPFVMIRVMASDLQPDGSEGSGLHPEAYSYDGGETWTCEPEYRMDHNGSVVIAVRDLVGNIGYWTQDITNIDSEGPEISYELSCNSWTKDDVTLMLSAKDQNGDGSNGIGIPEKWYSLDGGNTWSDAKEVVFQQNTDLTVIARDNNDNRSEIQVLVTMIDKELPWVRLTSQIIDEGLDKKAVLTAEAGDGGSGLAEEAYSWDKGCSYGVQDTMTVTEDGIYQITVRDKAGNWNYEQIEISGISYLPVLPVMKKSSEKREITKNDKERIKVENVEETTEEPEKESVTVIQEARIDKPGDISVSHLEEVHRWDWKDTVVLASVSLLTLGLGGFIYVLIMCTMAVYCEDAEGNMKYIGRQFLHYKEDKFEITVSEQLFERCVTTHFLLRPCRLFLYIHEGKEISCLFPEDICVIKQIEHEIEISLL